MNILKLTNRVKRSTRYLFFYLFVCFASVILTSCIYDKKCPDNVDISITLDWNKRTSGIDIPSKCLVLVDEKAYYFNSEGANTLKLQPGRHNIIIYTYNAKNFNFTNNNAYINNIEGGLLYKPGWLFSSSLIIDAEYGMNPDHRIPMTQQVRQLTIDLTIIGNPSQISNATVKLEGFAGMLDLRNNTHSVNSVKIPDFKINEGKLSTTVRMLGIIPDETQNFILEFNITRNKIESIKVDLSDKLKGFNTDKYEPLFLSANLIVSENPQIGAVISDWQVENKGEIIVD